MNTHTHRILIVDDESTNLAILNISLSREGYSVLAANSGARALEIALLSPYPDIILLDIRMPDMDGYEVLAALKANRNTQHIPVIFITAMEADDNEAKGLMLGAVDYISKPITPEIMLARVKTHLSLKLAQDILQHQNKSLEAEVTRRMQENQVIQDVSIQALAHLAEMRDSDTGKHISRTRAYVHILAQNLHYYPRFKSTLTDVFIKDVAKSAVLHDIGKVGIPDAILLKKGKLTADEWKIMQTHAVLGAQAIECVEQETVGPVEFLSLAKEIAHWHHERWNGTGYPDGLIGDAIPISARLMALADVFDALITQRPYKEAMSFEQARECITSERGEHFDPDIVDVFLDNFDEFVRVAQEFSTPD